ncbi:MULTISPECIES: L-aspartate oxidase [Vitreoscilla]|uniref:L-aspartate oxidase n=1 Tax=Vitreoscilla stercoraria TaxID=61 RepID=A0ABY4EJD8_VITST|nr:MULTISPECIES: L-aspartate oxidase [Vitreoscilla]UOO93492.1 L-aspartate oxidase [Vitreoscilla stercoraria]
MNMPKNSYDVVIIGAGLAGLSVALSLPTHLSVLLLSKEDLHTCSSNRAQGGIAAVMDLHDSVEEHVQDTLIAGAGLCHETAVRHIVSQGKTAIEWLCAHGVPFTYEQEDATQLHLTREGGHGKRRVVHAADHTGFSVTQTLQQQVRQYPNIDIVSHVQVTQLQVQNGVCVGLSIQDAQQHNHSIQAAKIVLASGGAGQLFALTTNPITATADGMALAAHAGCHLHQMAFIQFHPTALALPQNPCFLMSEALRGEGAILRNAMGERFMPAYDERAELAPRDIVARAIADQIQKTSQVYLDITHKPLSFIQHHFPSIYEFCLTQHQLDISQQWIPVAPAAHYACGGVVTDEHARTHVTHLYAVGEVACTGLHGANRLASNSLLECVVMGQQAAQHIVSNGAWDDFEPPFSNSFTWQNIDWHMTLDLQDAEDDFSPELLQQQMSQFFGIQRQSQAMQALYQRLLTWWQQSLASEHKRRLMLTAAILMVYDGLQQTTNHGAFFNVDLEAVVA